MKQALFSSCWECLTETSIDAKLAKVQRLVSAWHQGQVEILQHEACRPLAKAGLPENLRLVHPAKVARRRLGTEAGRIALLHAVAHIEFNAINLAVDAAYRFRGMPPSYYANWLRVAAEECYHFSLIRNQLKRMGSDYARLPAHHGLWDVAVYSASDVLTRMALVPRVLEARGLDVAPSMIERVEAVNDNQFADILRIILRDEVRHVRTGSEWFRALCKQRGIDSTIEFDKILRQYMNDLNAHIKGPFHVSARLRAGFNQTEIDNLSRYA